MGVKAALDVDEYLEDLERTQTAAAGADVTAVESDD
jgi:hypothetical protein